MSEAFVGREEELGRLHAALKEVLQGKTHVCFIRGEAGTGKTALLQAFANQVQGIDPNLLIVRGNCNDITGLADPYLPFRHILASLLIDEARVVSNTISATNSERLKGVLKTSGRALVEIAPELIGTLIPGAGILATLAKIGVEEKGLLKELEERSKKGEKSDSEVDQSEIYTQYTTFLKELSKAHPLIIALDDLQWADTSSVALLFHLARELKKSKIMIVGLYRQSDVSAGRNGERHPLEAVIAEVKRDRGNGSIDLDDATMDSGRAFIDAIVDSEPNRLDIAFRNALFEHTGGHALFTVELLREMQDRGDLLKDTEGYWQSTDALEWGQLPVRVEAVVEERIERLEDALRDILTVASVEGQDFTAQVIARAEEIRERDILRDLSRELEKRHHLVREIGEHRAGYHMLSRYTFAHSLFQRYLYKSLGASERRLLHGEIARILENLYDGNTSEISPQLALHFRAAGDTEKTIIYLLHAGKRSLIMAALSEAVTHLQEGVDLIRNSDTGSHSHTLMEFEALLGKTYRKIGKYRTAREHHQRCLEIAQRLNKTEAVAEQYCDIGACCWMLREDDAAMSYLTTAYDCLGELGEPLLRSKILSNLGVVYGRRNDPESVQKSVDYLEQALALANVSDNISLKTTVLNNLANKYSFLYGDFHRAIDMLTEALKIAETNHNLSGQSIYYFNLSNQYRRLGDYSQTKSYARLALQISQDIGAVSGIARGFRAISEVLLLEKNNTEARAQMEEALEWALEGPHHLTVVYAKSHLALVHLQNGDLSVAVPLAHEAVQYAKMHNAIMIGKAFNEHLLYVISLARSGMFAEATLIVKEHLPYLVKRKELSWAAVYCYGLALACQAVTDPGSVKSDEVLRAYQTSIASCRAEGIVAEAILALDELSKADELGALETTRAFMSSL